MVKNIFAIIGVYVVCKVAYKAYDKHLRQPLERTITDALADERQNRQSAQ